MRLTWLALFVLTVVATARAQDEAKYSADISKRADDIVKALDLKDDAKAAHVHETVVSQYRDLRALDDVKDAQQKHTQLHELHEKFLKKLADDLTPQQVDVVKDKMTYNVLHVTYNAYCDMLPTLTDTQKAKIKELLTEAREQAMDGGSSKEKHEIFSKYKGKINVYLAKEGYDLKKATKEWAERRKSATTRAAS